MKKLIYSILVFSVVTLSGCGSSSGGGGSSSTNQNRPPSISNLSFSPTSATVGQGGGSISILGQFNFIDQDSDIVATFVESDLGQAAIETIRDYSIGSINIAVTAETATAGQFPFKVWVTDSNGNKSNELTGTFTVN